MDVGERFDLVGRNAVEVVTPNELKDLLSREGRPKAYLGLEPSGLVHLGTGPLLAGKIIDLENAGFEVTVLLADWHAYINDKLGGDWDVINAAADYLAEAYRSLGVPESVRSLRGSELVSGSDYWRSVLRVSKASTVARMRRALSIMGRKEEEAELDASRLIYPAMQVADIHQLDLDLALGGMDQRHAHMLYRDLAPKLGWKQVVALHTPMLASLQGGGRMDSWDLKMSKSKPETCIFIHDSPGEIEEKIRKAYCPPREVERNPILQFCQYIVFPHFSSMRVERKAAHGGDVEYASYEALEGAYREDKLHPQDIKAAVVRYLVELFAPSRDYFESHPETLRRVTAALDL